MKIPTLTLDKRASLRVAQGYPWVFRSDIDSVKQYDSITPGSLAVFANAHGEVMATGYLNPRSQLMGRILAKGRPDITVDFFKDVFKRALAWRQTMFGTDPYYRLIHAESDHMPGLIVDLFGDVAVCQTNTAGMESLKPLWVPALLDVVKPATIIHKDDTPPRATEGLPEQVVVGHGQSQQGDKAKAIENETAFHVDIWNGQKTGWFYDQRPHRKWIAAHAAGKSVIDVFCHTGGFGVTAARHGASAITFVDSSQPAIDLVKDNVALNGIAAPCEYLTGKAFDVLDQLKQQNKQYDMVCIDPPAFVKSKSDLRAGLNGYAKLARQAGSLVKPGGLLFFASCSSHPTLLEFQNAVQQGLLQAKRPGYLVYHGTADSDHPQHPALPETGYLKALAFRVD